MLKHSSKTFAYNPNTKKLIQKRERGFQHVLISKGGEFSEIDPLQSSITQRLWGIFPPDSNHAIALENFKIHVSTIFGNKELEETLRSVAEYVNKTVTHPQELDPIEFRLQECLSDAGRGLEFFLIDILSRNLTYSKESSAIMDSGLGPMRFRLTHKKTTQEQDYIAKADIYSRISYEHSNDVCGEAGIGVQLAYANPIARESLKYIDEKRRMVQRESRLMNDADKRNFRKKGVIFEDIANFGIDFSSLFLVYDRKVRSQLTLNSNIFLQAYLNWKESGCCFTVGPIEFVRTQNPELAEHIEFLAKMYDFGLRRFMEIFYLEKIKEVNDDIDLWVPEYFIEQNIEVVEEKDTAARRYRIIFYSKNGEKRDILAEWDFYPNKHFLRHFRDDLKTLRPMKRKKIFNEKRGEEELS